ncbi:adenylosuccinate lyase [Bradyrhizobium sp. CCBAU 51765]|uniref:adenylosuccinate lyase n=1 Tax=Bradyrhizobium sp. CCBAU 51765 TaxID=1325102 RepID=UPI0018870F86|nr:adenylosuccinate lyase [Bradyrhizobium sp. CCBAU 51765]QOZ06648.1 adenylosuccinate lyase [Bradyrhizobium sp. CCBAU 51765]
MIIGNRMHNQRRINAMSDALMNISPVDGRYERYTEPLRPIMSEFGLIKYRVEVMVRYVLALGEHKDIPLNLGQSNVTVLEGIIHSFAHDDALSIKQLETKGWNGILATNHDLKSCELWLRWKFGQLGLGGIVEWIHFGCTSEDVNNIAYGLMLRDAIDVLMESLQSVTDWLHGSAAQCAQMPMLSRTHGQPATPTTLGKEFAIFDERLRRQMRQMAMLKIALKLNGASGNYAAMHAALPGVDWPQFAQAFVENGTYLRRGAHVSFSFNPLTTQIEPHDTYAELFAAIMRINTILVDVTQDMWRYISDEWIVQKPIAGEIGSSAMPHKVNPINFENAEGNLQIANWLMEGCCRKLPVSRLQRDLSDSTVVRVFGTIFGHCMVGYENLHAGMKKVSPDAGRIRQALVEHPEVLAEAYQTILRSKGFPDAYDALKSLSRGAKITLADLHAFVDGLDPSFIDDETKRRMKGIMPDTYVGLAPSLVRAG